MITLDLDDIHPENGFLMPPDRPSQILSQIINEFPNLKIILFVTPDWIFKSQLPLHKFRIRLPERMIRQWMKGTFKLDRFPRWCSWLNQLMANNNIDVGIHGLHHFRSRWPFAAEFQNLTYEAALERIERAEEIFEKAGLDYKKIFRPPGWGISAGLIKALRHKKYELASLDEINADLYRTTDKQIKKLIEHGKRIILHGHISNYCGISRNVNGLVSNYSQLRRILFHFES